MREHIVLYSADLHGNEAQFRRLVDYARNISADTVIIGGDIAPKGLPAETYIEGQRKFLQKRLPDLLRPLKEELPDSMLFLMMGNDDCATNLDVLEKNDPDLYQVIHGKRINLVNGFDIVGYSYSPVSPFAIKDWEKFDLSHVPANLEREYTQRKRTNYGFEGFKSTSKGWEKFSFSQETEESDSIQGDLADQLFRMNADKTICVIHTPPNRTNLDMTFDGRHVGSMAVRLFIERHQPYLSLHGHVHEATFVSGSFKDCIGRTLCMSPGNHDAWEKPAVLVFDLYNPQDAKRIIID